MGIWEGIGSLLGDVIGAWSGREQAEDNRTMQREFAQHGVRWKVEDAQRAGVHPLFALGASTVGYAPNPVVPFGSSLRDMGQAIDERNKPISERAKLAAELKMMEAASERDFAEASFYRSKAAMARHESEITMPFPEQYTEQVPYRKAQMAGNTPEDKFQVWNPYSDAIIRRVDPELWDVPEPIPIGARGGIDNPTRAQPGWTAFDFGDGPIVLPYTPPGQGLMESLEGLDVKYLPAVIAENRRRYGQKGADRMRKLYTEWNYARPQYGGSRDRNPRVGPGGGYMPRRRQ